MNILYKNTLLLLLLATLHVNATDLDTLDVSDRVKQQLVDGVELNQTIKQFEQVRSGGAFVTVGNGVTCDYRLGSTKIQDAIDDGATEIRIANNDSYLENFTINEAKLNVRHSATVDNNAELSVFNLNGIDTGSTLSSSIVLVPQL